MILDATFNSSRSQMAVFYTLSFTPEAWKKTLNLEMKSIEATQNFTYCMLACYASRVNKEQYEKIYIAYIFSLSTEAK